MAPTTNYFLLLLLSFSLLISAAVSSSSATTASSASAASSSSVTTASTTTATTYTPQSKPPKPDPKYTSFVKTACNTTAYPSLCLKSCLPYAAKIKADSRKLAGVALSATLTAAKTAASTVTSLSQQKNLATYDANVIKDCIENMGDSIDDLNQSIAQIKNLSGSDLKFKISNVETWMSAAITNENTCMDGIGEHRVSPSVKSKIRGCILRVAKLTSNALCICNHLQY